MADKDSLNDMPDMVDTYKSGRGVSWPELNFAEENLAGLLADIKSNYKRVYQVTLSFKLYAIYLQSRLMIVSPRVDKMKNCDSILL